MTGACRRGVLLLLCAVSAGCLTAGPAALRGTMSIEITPYPLAWTREVQSIRLTPARDGAVLLVARQDDAPALFWLPAEPDGGSPHPFATLGGRLGVPAWDVSADAEGSWVVVSTNPGSAISGLRFQRAQDTTEVPVSAHSPGGVFLRPRFVRGDRGLALPISALESQASGNDVVLFLREEGQGWGAPRRLWTADQGIVQQAVLVRHGDGYLLFAKTYVPGTVPVDAAGRLPERVDASGESTLPGIVSCIPLGPDFAPAGPELFPLGPRQVYEIDADAAGPRAILFATTGEGLLLAVGAPEAGAWRTDHVAETVRPEILTTPRLAVAEGRLYMAVIASPGRDDMSLLVGNRSMGELLVE